MDGWAMHTRPVSTEGVRGTRIARAATVDHALTRFAIRTERVDGGFRKEPDLAVGALAIEGAIGHGHDPLQRHPPSVVELHAPALVGAAAAMQDGSSRAGERTDPDTIAVRRAVVAVHLRPPRR